LIILNDKPAFTSLFTFRVRPMCCCDNLKSAVLERVGQTIRFNEKLLRMASRPCPGDRSKTVREACNDSSGGSSRRRRRQLKRAAPELISSP